MHYCDECISQRTGVLLGFLDLVADELHRAACALERADPVVRAGVDDPAIPIDFTAMSRDELQGAMARLQRFRDAGRFGGDFAVVLGEVLHELGPAYSALDYARRVLSQTPGMVSKPHQ
jgi:hypothetical protein